MLREKAYKRNDKINHRATPNLLGNNFWSVDEFFLMHLLVQTVTTMDLPVGGSARGTCTRLPLPRARILNMLNIALYLLLFLLLLKHFLNGDGDI